MEINRRSALGLSIGALLATVEQSSAAQQDNRTRIILLGTAGGPPARMSRAAPSSLIAINNALYVIDCGNGVARQIVRAGFPVRTLKSIFITHQHSDHNLDYGNLFYLAWVAGLKDRVDSYGPPPLAQMTKSFFELNQFDIELRMRSEGRLDLRPLLVPHEVRSAGLVMQDENVKVSCVLADHPPIEVALSYRFDTPTRSVVFSGDTRKTDALINLAKGADVFVCEAQYLPGVHRLAESAAADPSRVEALYQSIITNALSVEQAGEVAQAAGVKTLVLSHYAPADDSVPENAFVDAARKTFSGSIIAGRDLLEI